jgi:hypothetical protein
MNKIIKEKLKRSSIWLVFLIALAVVFSIMIKYQFVGETNMPFKPSEMLVISSVEGINNIDNPEGYKFNLDIGQYNDIYIHFGESFNSDKYSIKRVTIENINYEGNAYTEEAKNNNSFKAYMPSSSGTKSFEADDTYLINHSLTFKGGQEDNNKALIIDSQGGSVLFRVENFNLPKYQSNDDEITYDGTLLEKLNIKKEDLEFKLSFDIVLETTEEITYRAKVQLDLPCGDILTEGTSKIDDKDLSDIIFKRD